MTGRSQTPLQAAGTPSAQTPQTVGGAVRHYFACRAAITRVELRQLLKRGRTSLLIGVAFLSVCLLLSQLVARYIPQGGLLAIPREGLTIGGVGGLMATDGDLFVRLVAHPPPRSPLEPVALD